MKKTDEELQAGKDEMNLVEYPITLLSKRHESELLTIEFSDTITGDEGRLIRREWIVTGSNKHGLPLAQDNDVLLALLALGKEQGFKSRKIFFSRYRLCQIMGWKLGGANYRRIEETLDRFIGTKVKANNAFYDKASRSYATKHFGIIDDYELYDSAKKGAVAQDTLPLSYANLSEVLYESIKSGYIKNLDMKTYYALESSITKRLYRYLDKKRYDGKRKYEINIFSLAETHLGLLKTKYASQIKQQIDPAHAELINNGFLKSAEYQKTNDGTSEKVIYTFGRRPELAEPKRAVNTSEPAGDELLSSLLRAGVARRVAEQLLKEYSRTDIEIQILALPARRVDDPAAALVASIQDGWVVPARLRREQVKKASAEANKPVRAEEDQGKIEHRRRIDEYLQQLSSDNLAALTEEARVLARQEGGAFFQERELPEPLVKSYVRILAEMKMGF